ncbi:MAG: hypothetical protein ACI4LP_08995 [Anaerovoracaceae bacterium]
MDGGIQKELLLGTCEEQIAFQNEYELCQMPGMQAYIRIMAETNKVEKSEYDEVSSFKVSNLCNAQAFTSSSEAFENPYFDVCTMDYGRIG